MAVGIVLALLLLVEAGNRHAWMRELDPGLATLPADGDAPMRIAILAGSTVLCALIVLGGCGPERRL